MAGRKENLKPWKPGQSGNPGGRPKRDIAAEIARAIFEGDTEAIQCVFAAELKKGNSKVFTALADRAYGKPHQSLDLSAGLGENNPACIRIEFVRTRGRPSRTKPPLKRGVLRGGLLWMSAISNLVVAAVADAAAAEAGRAVTGRSAGGGEDEPWAKTGLERRARSITLANGRIIKATSIAWRGAHGFGESSHKA